MTDTTLSSEESQSSWQGSDHHVRVPDTSMLPGTEKAPAAAVNLMKRAVQGAHETIDRLADGAAPNVRQLGEIMSGVDDALQAKKVLLRETRDEWSEALRSTVRRSPLVAVAAALALGALVARIAR